MQTASAFNSVQTALSYFINAYRQLAEWRAVIARLEGFNVAVKKGWSAARTEPAIQVRPQETQRSVKIDDLLVRLPQGKPLVAARDLLLRAGESVLVIGPSGAGKSTLFRAIAGAWPFGSGIVSIPRGAKLMMLPQRPYFPVGSLAAAIAYPSQPVAFAAEALADVLSAVGLPGLVEQLEEEAHWNRMLSLGEQQRLGIARAILQQPDYLFLDEATASLDEPAEAALYRLIAQRLAETTIVSIGHRSTLHAFHRRSLMLVNEQDHYRVSEAARAPAPL
jgi:putative ATP-binding cassette transporter